MTGEQEPKKHSTFDELILQLRKVHTKELGEAKKTQSQEAFNLAFELEAAQIEIENLKKRQQEMQQLLSNEIMAGTLEDASKADYKSVIQSLRFENSTLREQNRTLTAENLKLQDQQKDWFKLKDKISKFKAGILLKKKVKQPPTLNGATGERIKIEDNSAKVQPLPPNIQDILAPLNESTSNAFESVNILRPKIKSGKKERSPPKESRVKEEEIKGLSEVVDLTQTDTEPSIAGTEVTNPQADVAVRKDETHPVDNSIFPVSRLKRTRSLSYAEKQPWARAQREAANEPNYAYRDVVRKKEDRKHLHATDCPCCRDFHKATGLPDRVLHEGRMVDRIQLVSRHRFKHPDPETPPGFWDLDYSVLYSTDDEENGKGTPKKKPKKKAAQ